MDRRRFLNKALALSASAAGASLVNTQTQAGLFEQLLVGVDQTRGTLLDRIDVVMRNANKAFRGLYHGYGLGIRQILDETRGPLPTKPKRSHAGWPHVHCVCHCNTVANLGPEDGVYMSRVGGIADEVNQTVFAQMYYDLILPMTWTEVSQKWSGPGGEGKAEREVRFVINYCFGDSAQRRKSLTLASLEDKSNRQTLRDYRDLIFGLIDAIESAWQKSDLHDNAMGREGGLRCPENLSASGKRDFCHGWCTQNGVPTNVAEGRRTERPWGPFHPLYPGPVPTAHDELYGALKEPFDPKLNVPPKEYQEIRLPHLEGMYTLPVYETGIGQKQP